MTSIQPLVSPPPDAAELPVRAGLPDFDTRQRALLRVLGQQLLAASQCAKARVVFMALLHLDPAHPADLAAAATTLQAEGQFAQAASLFQMSLLLGSTDAAAALHLAECRLALGDAAGVRHALDLAAGYAEAAGESALLARIDLMRGGPTA